MAVYVDNARFRYRNMLMCHMVADTTLELLKMAKEIGVDGRHLQAVGTWREHMDICLSKRRLAVAHGAAEVTSRDLVRIRRRKWNRKTSEGAGA